MEANKMNPYLFEADIVKVDITDNGVVEFITSQRKKIVINDFGGIYTACDEKKFLRTGGGIPQDYVKKELKGKRITIAITNK